MTTIKAALRNAAFALAAAGLAVSAPALAQRSPEYQAARASGQVGEKMDGYLGVVGAGNAQLKAMVDDLNIRRRANYAQNAQAQGATLEEYALTQGCVLIANTSPGEMYQAPDGSWQKRTASAPLRDPRCR